MGVIRHLKKRKKWHRRHTDRRTSRLRDWIGPGGRFTQTYRHTDTQTDGHRDSQTESAPWANSVKRFTLRTESLYCFIPIMCFINIYIYIFFFFFWKVTHCHGFGDLPRNIALILFFISCFVFIVDEDKYHHTQIHISTH